MPGYILSSQGDRVAMANSVEGRFPFLDHRVAELAARIPPRLKMKGLREKYLLKRAAGHLIPASVVQRPKQPYRAPDAKSFFDSALGSARHDYVEDVLSPERVRRDGLFYADAVARLVQKARSGRVTGTRDNMALVGILSTQLVIEQFLNNFRAWTAGPDDLRAGGPGQSRPETASFVLGNRDCTDAAPEPLYQPMQE